MLSNTSVFFNQLEQKIQDNLTFMTTTDLKVWQMMTVEALTESWIWN